MASTAPSTPVRRRIYSADNEAPTPAAGAQSPPRPGCGGVRPHLRSTDNPSTGHEPIPRTGSGASGSRPRLPSSDIPRTYSGLYGSGDGAPLVPDFPENDDCNRDSNAALSPPRIHSSLPQQSTPSKSRVVPHPPRHHYQAGSNLLPFELSRNRNTDWIAAGGPPLLLTYLSLILIFLLTSLAFVPEPKMAWTLTNIVHAMVSMVYLHWIKGNPADYMDGTQGEMNAMTLWEQIVSKPATHLHRESASGLSGDGNYPTSEYLPAKDHKYPSKNRNFNQQMGTRLVRGQGRDVLCVVPTLLAYASCYVAKYQYQYAIVNVGVWAAVMLPKMPFMNGVRILGINKTTGIDDEDYCNYEDEDCLETEDEDWNEIDSKGSVSLGFEIDVNHGYERMINNPVGTEIPVDEPKKDR